ncbi:helix-turn-helix domain-containing protein [Leptolyngbya sp. 7M]|uniref:helix-turn-helix domain-containing protein n=1 Tax=Leptolyngbya sp. 7M TaxID=2812896 RepID=UPI001B8D8AEE|nr:AraC family transcriptional regulator [Leptolyngbya sp. 7M]QYO62295.1 AraC family transcriptional regulator [Leptolyngbya sp. 7M]
MLTIEFEPQLLGTLVTGQPESLPEWLEPLVGDANQLTYFRTGTTTTTMQSVLQQTLNCPYEGLTKRMYLEGKVLELMALQFSQLLMAEKSPHSSDTRSLRSDEIDRIHHARMLLGQNLDNPPSVLDLARQVGLNRRKLNEGFRQVLGTTPFGYVRDRRLEQAQQLSTGQKMKGVEKLICE